jgi:parallel beta-helix repeat protein
MKRSIYILIGCLIVAVGAPMPTSAAEPTTHHVCQDCDPLYYYPQYSTITAALAAADDDDTINIWGEETSPGSGKIFEYEEHLVIDKRITLTCDNPEPDLGYPIITHPFTGNPAPDAIIHITQTGAESVIKHLNIRGPAEGLITDCGTPTQDPMGCMGDKIGIRIEADNCTIHDVHITRCMTGIFITGTGNYINGNYIGDRWWDPLDPVDHREEYWNVHHHYDISSLVYINHPGNGFGIVAEEPDWLAPQGQSYESRSHNKISDNIIRSNRYWGVVLTNGSRAEVAHNIIAWNGDYLYENAWPSIPDKSGGLLSLFTADQISNTGNDNKLQAPIIRSNNIYGNKGYQIGVFTESGSCMEIYNSPVIMSNNIGVEHEMPPFNPDEEYDFLICAGPTPDRTNTPNPQTPVTTLTPTPATPTPEPCNPDYPYYGSGPIFAWNNYHDPTDGHQRRMYHPMQKERWPSPVEVFTPTPYPTQTPSLPTSTPTPAPPTRTPQMTSIPTPDTPDIIPPGPPGPDYYQMGAPSWEIHGMREDPRFVGWITPTPGYPPEFDWHLRDHSDDPERLPSNNFNRGGINLNPGTTRSDGLWDSGFVDMGRHIRELVPPVENLVIDMNIHHDLPDYYYLFWDAPTYYPDGTLFHFHDIGGYIVHFGQEENQTGNTMGTISPIGRPEYVSASTTEYSFFVFEIPRDATHAGVIIYTVRGAHAEIQWIRIPEPNS